MVKLDRLWLVIAGDCTVCPIIDRRISSFPVLEAIAKSDSKFFQSLKWMKDETKQPQQEFSKHQAALP